MLDHRVELHWVELLPRSLQAATRPCLNMRSMLRLTQRCEVTLPQETTTIAPSKTSRGFLR